MDEEPGLFADTIAPVHRSRFDEVFMVRVEAKPAPGTSEAAEFGGAYVVCWIDADDLRTAELRAYALVRENGWFPLRLDDWAQTTKEDYEPGQEYRPQVAQALDEGSAFVFFLWPLDAPDANDTDI